MSRGWSEKLPLALCSIVSHTVLTTNQVSCRSRHCAIPEPLYHNTILLNESLPYLFNSSCFATTNQIVPKQWLSSLTVSKLLFLIGIGASHQLCPSFEIIYVSRYLHSVLAILWDWEFSPKYSIDIFTIILHWLYNSLLSSWSNIWDAGLLNLLEYDSTKLYILQIINSLSMA